MSVPRNRFLAMEMDTVYTTVGQREKLLDNLEKNIKRDLLETKRKELNEDLYKVCHITDKCKICPFNIDGRHCKLFTKLDEVCSQSSVKEEGKE